MLAGRRRALRRGLVEAAMALALAAAAWALYASVRQLWWIHDDAFHLRYLLTRRPFWYLFDPAGFRELGGRVLAPLLFASLDLDRRAFGLEPRAFYVHHLAAVAALAVAVYAAARAWLARPWAAAAAWLVLVGPVTAALASMLMVRHYLEAGVLAALSTLAWARALGRSGQPGAWRIAWLSAILYFAACMAKEVAVPLAVLLPLLPAPGPRAVGLRLRARLALPHAAALAVYLAIRHAVVGAGVTAYGFAVRAEDLPALALKLPLEVAAEFAGGRASAAAAVLAVALVAGVLAVATAGRPGAVAAAALALALLPVLPVSTRMEPRFAAAAWVVVAVAFAAGCAALARRRRAAAVAIAVVACASGAWLNREDWRVRFAAAERMSVENRFVLDMRQGDVLRQPLALGATLGELAWLKEAAYRRPRGGGWFQDDLFLSLHADRLGRVWGYDPAARRVVEITGRIDELRERHRAAIRAEAPLSARFHVAGTDLFWELGPHRGGRYAFVLDDGGQAIEMPRVAGFQLQRRPALALRVRYEAPAGWITYSPELSVRLADGAAVAWSRP
jgi:hypothetical protein